MDIPIESVVITITLGIWFPLIKMIYDYVISMKETSHEDIERRKLHLWGVVRYFAVVSLVSTGSVFFLLTPQDWDTFVNLLCAQPSRTVAVAFWSLAGAVFVYFLLYRGSRERKRRGLSKGGEPYDQ